MESLMHLSRWLVVGILFVAMWGGLFQTVQASPAPNRALWVWQNHSIIQDAKQRQEFFAFLREPKPGSAAIGRLFLSATWALKGSAEDKEGLRSFIIEAHKQGVAVDLLDGASHWALSYSVGDVKRLLGSLADWQRDEANVGGAFPATFDGLQLDVEPYLLAGWPSVTLMEGWKDMAARVRTFLDENPDLGVSFGLAIPIWLDQAKYNFINEPLQQITDYVALMDYRDSASRIVRDAAGELTVADRLGRQVFVGVETKDINPPSITFFQEGNAVMEAELSLAAAELQKHPSFAGIAIHHYETYRALKP